MSNNQEKQGQARELHLETKEGSADLSDKDLDEVAAAGTTINLKFENRSNDEDNSGIIIFHRNQSPSST